MARLTVFDIFAAFAHFKRPYTTTSPITFPFPPKPTIYGMISAIVGLDKDEYLNHFHNRGVRVAVRILKPINKIYIAENLINTKEGFSRFKTHTQIRIEFLKNAAYRLYVSIPDSSPAKSLPDKLREHRSHYTLSMGLSECLANFRFVGEYETETRIPGPGEYVDIHSVLPVAALPAAETAALRFAPGQEIFRVSMPLELDPRREIQAMTELVYERNGLPIPARVAAYEAAPELNEHVVLF